MNAPTQGSDPIYCRLVSQSPVCTYCASSVIFPLGECHKIIKGCINAYKCLQRDPIPQTAPQRQSQADFSCLVPLTIRLSDVSSFSKNRNHDTPSLFNHTYQTQSYLLESSASRSSALNLRREPAGFFTGLNHVYPLSRSSQAAH